MAEEAAARMLALLAGHENAHGTHGTPSAANWSKGGKQEIKGTARTLRGGPTLEMWREHLAGTTPLGVVPIRQDSTCLWACVDVDRYDLRHDEIVRDLERRGLPLIVCRSKSGGAHVFMFMAHPMPASEVRLKMREIASVMGWADCEIFPKQSELVAERDDLGNWLNMPYLGGNKTERWAVRPNGSPMSLDEFLDRAESSRVELLDDVVVKRERRRSSSRGGNQEEDNFQDSPPCLEELTASGFPDGTRNRGLFNLGILAKRKFPDRWKDVLRSWNEAYLVPPLESDEVDEVVRNVGRKDYHYQCRETPCVSHCNAGVCRGRAHGVRTGGDFPVIEGLTKIDSEPPLFLMDVYDKRIELTHHELYSYRDWRRAAQARIDHYFPTMKDDDWGSLVNVAIEKLQVQEAGREVSTIGQFEELLSDFLTSQFRGTTLKELQEGLPILMEDDGRFYFQLRDLMKFLERHNFRVWNRTQVAQRIVGELGGGKRSFNRTGAKNLRTYWLPGTMFDDPEPADIPSSPREPI